MATKRKYTAIAKIYPDKFVKYRTNYPLKLIDFLEQKFTRVLWANFYYKTGTMKGKIYATWGKKKGLIIN